MTEITRTKGVEEPPELDPGDAELLVQIHEELAREFPPAYLRLRAEQSASGGRTPPPPREPPRRR